MAKMSKIRVWKQPKSFGEFEKQLIKVSGIDDIKLKIHSVNGKFKKQIRKGLTKAALLLQRMSQKVVPVDTGNLKASAGTAVTGEGWETEAYVYYAAGYAVYVHERHDLTHKAGKQAEFLAGPMREHRKLLMKTIALEIKG